MVIIATEKHQQLLFYSSEAHFRSLNLVLQLLFEEMLVLMSYNVNYVTIIKQGFLCKLFCYVSLVDIQVKYQNTNTSYH